MMKKSRPFVALIVLLAFGITYGCAVPASTVKRKPIYENAGGVTELPEKLKSEPEKKGTIVPVEKGQAAPFAGILLTEERAKKVAKLRLAYDHLYNIADINRRFIGTVLKTADKQLADADQEIVRLRKLNDSWWSRNKLWVGIVIGTALTLGLGGFAVWGVSELKK